MNERRGSYKRAARRELFWDVLFWPSVMVSTPFAVFAAVLLGGHVFGVIGDGTAVSATIRTIRFSVPYISEHKEQP